MNSTAVTYGYEFSNQQISGSQAMLWNLESLCNGATFTIQLSNFNGNGGDWKILHPDGNTTTVPDGTTTCMQFTVNIGETIGVSKLTNGVFYGAGTITGFAVSGGGC